VVTDVAVAAAVVTAVLLLVTARSGWLYRTPGHSFTDQKAGVQQ
jgi:hypothetical protein